MTREDDTASKKTLKPRGAGAMPAQKLSASGKPRKAAQKTTKRATAPKKAARAKLSAQATATERRGTRTTAKAASAPKRISLDELMARLADPDVPEEELIPYVTTTQAPRAGLAPTLLPSDNVDIEGSDPAARARGDLGLGFLNSVYQARRRRLFDRRIADKDKRPALIAEGDSWFQYPMFLDDVIDYLDDDYNVLCLSGAGDELRTMVAQAEYRDYLTRLTAKGVAFRAFLFSAGGNDVVGDQMKAFLRKHDPGLDAAGHIDTAAFNQKVAALVTDFEIMIAAVHAILPKLPILAHGYDYSVPLPDQSFSVPPKDGWLGKPMRALGIPDGPLQAEIVRIMMDTVNSALAGLAGGNVAGGRHADVYFVDNRNIVQGRWADELHPNDKGFQAVAENFRRVMREKAGVP